jgi:hypothetical protein
MEVAKVAAFIVSDEACPVTGTIINLSGNSIID